MKKINVLHLLTTSNIRGSEKLVIDMSDQSNSNKFNYLVCTLYPSGDLHKLATKKKIRSFSLNAKVNFFLAGLRMWRLLNDHEVDIVHVYGFRTDILCRLVLLFSKTNILVSAIHSVYDECPKIIFFIDKMLSPLVNLFISNSVIGAEFHKSHTKIDNDKYFVAHSGVNTSALKQDCKENERHVFRDKNNIPNNSIIITLLAGITGEKGHDVAIKAFSIIKNKYSDSDIKLVFAGKDFTDGGMEVFARKKEVIKDIFFLGFCDSKKVHQIMNTTDIFILPSLREGLPTVVIEAMSYGLPVIATDVGGTSELLINGETGYLIKPSDVNSLIKKLSILIENELQRITMGKSGRKLVETKFSLKQMTLSIEKKYLELYQSKDS